MWAGQPDMLMAEQVFVATCFKLFFLFLSFFFFFYPSVRIKPSAPFLLMDDLPSLCPSHLLAHAWQRHRESITSLLYTDFDVIFLWSNFQCLLLDKWLSNLRRGQQPLLSYVVCGCGTLCLFSFPIVCQINNSNLQNMNKTLIFRWALLHVCMCNSSPIHTALWVQGSCANSLHRPLCENLECDEGWNFGRKLANRHCSGNAAAC